MKLYGTESGQRLFAHQDRVNGLKSIEVSNVKTALLNYGNVFTIEVLLDIESLVADDLGELKRIGAGDYDTDTLNIDFTKDLSYAEIASHLVEAYAGHYSAQMDIINNLNTHWKAQSNDWNGDIQDIIHNPNGISAIHINIDHYNELVETTVMKTDHYGKILLTDQ